MSGIRSTMTSERFSWILTFSLIFLLYSHQVHGLVEFTNVKCEALDKTFCRYEYCYLKSVNRTYKYLSMHTKLFKLPIKNFGVAIKLYKRSNGYKPFLIQTTLEDGCQFLGNQHLNKVAELFYRLVAPYSNLNSSCPIENDVVVDKFPISHVNQFMTNMQVMPKSDYYLDLTWSSNGKNNRNIKVFFTYK